jgi:hypothetical protein
MPLMMWYAILAVLPTPQVGILAGVAVVLAALGAACLATRLAGRTLAGGGAVAVGVAALRARIRRARPIRLMDPDAAGRPRPRAPALS